MNCSKCNTEVLQDTAYCLNCGNPLTTQGEPDLQNQGLNQSPYMASRLNYDVVPPEINKWNWGAFTLNIIWGIGNHAYLTLLCLVPLLNIVWVFICGANGNKWAWQSGQFKSVEEFQAVQKTWNRAGLAMFILQLIFIVLYLLIFAVAFAGIVSSMSL